MMKKSLLPQLLLLCATGMCAQVASAGPDGDAVRRRAEEEAMAVRLSYNMRREAVPVLERYMLSRETLKAKCDSLFPDNLRERMKRKVRIDRIYQDSINTVIIPSRTNKV